MYPCEARRGPAAAGAPVRGGAYHLTRRGIPSRSFRGGASPHDVRARRPGLDALVLLHRGRRLLSALVLVLLDLTGVTLALYAALVLRNAYRGEKVLFGLPWAAISNWLQFIALVLVLVFARAGLYRQREARPGADAVIRSLALVTIITGVYAVAVAGMTFHSFYGIFWVTFVLAATSCRCCARATTASRWS